jgi:ubiquitin-protein ligase
MVSFSCPACGRAFNVPGKYAGRSTRCACGASFVVPAAGATVAAAAPSAGVSGLRARRLVADEREMREAFDDANPIVRIESTHGAPAEKYVVALDVRSIVRGKPEQTGESHRVEVELTHDYPRVGPRCRMLTPIFHPNIDAAAICVGDHWTAGERLTDLIARIAEMLAYQAYNVRSPLNAEAAMWADQNASRLPIDARDLRAEMIRRA